MDSKTLKGASSQTGTVTPARGSFSTHYPGCCNSQRPDACVQVSNVWSSEKCSMSLPGGWFGSRRRARIEVGSSHFQPVLFSPNQRLVLFENMIARNWQASEDTHIQSNTTGPQEALPGERVQ